MHMIFPFYTFNCHAGIKYKPYPEYLPIYPHFRLFNPSKSHCLMLNSPCSLARSPCLIDKSLYPHQIPHFVQTFPHIIPQSLIQRVPMMWRFPTRRWFLGVFNMNGGRDEWWYWRNFAKKTSWISQVVSPSKSDPQLLHRRYCWKPAGPPVQDDKAPRNARALPVEQGRFPMSQPRKMISPQQMCILQTIIWILQYWRSNNCQSDF